MAPLRIGTISVLGAVQAAKIDSIDRAAVLVPYHRLSNYNILRSGGRMKYARVALSIIAAVFTGGFAREVVMTRKYASAETATGLVAVASGLVEALLSPLFGYQPFCCFLYSSRRVGLAANR